MKTEKRVGQRIKENLEEKGIQAKTLAEHLGVTQAAMSNYLNNKRNIDTDTLTKIAIFLDVTTDDLLGRPKRTSRLGRGLSALIEDKTEKDNLKVKEAMELFTQLNDPQKEIILNLSRSLVDNNNETRKSIEHLKNLFEKK